MTLNEIRQLSVVDSAREWKDRVYINLKGNGGNYAGERNTKIWMSKDGKLNVERGKGLTSSEWDSQLRELQAVVTSKATA